jgi:hypothetical protein
MKSLLLLLLLHDCGFKSKSLWFEAIIHITAKQLIQPHVTHHYQSAFHIRLYLILYVYNLNVSFASTEA